jgi:hypothetical protein
MQRNENKELCTGEASTEAAIFDLDAYRKDDAIRRRLGALLDLVPGSSEEGLLREAVLIGLEQLVGQALHRRCCS